MSLEKSLQQISEQALPLGFQAMLELSGLSPKELGLFARTWHKVPSERRRAVVERLVEMAEDNAEMDFSAVLKLCLKDPDESVKRKAMSGLWEFEDRSLILSLVELLKSDDSGEVRAAAAAALGKFASLAQDRKILSKDGDLVRGSLMEALEDEQEWLEVRRRALESMAAFDTSNVAEYIHWAYESDDLNLKCSSIYAMGKTGEPKWLEILLRELQSSSPPLRYEAATACGELAAEEAAPHLIPLLQDDDFQVQMAGIDALGEIGGTLAKRALMACVKRGDTIIVDAARNALENVRTMEDPLGFHYEP